MCLKAEFQSGIPLEYYFYKKAESLIFILKNLNLYQIHKVKKKKNLVYFKLLEKNNSMNNYKLLFPDSILSKIFQWNSTLEFRFLGKIKNMRFFAEN